MKKLFTVKNAVLASVVALSLGLFASVASAYINIPWSLLANDPYCPYRPGCHEQVHNVTLYAGTTYVIDMRSSQIDSYLYLEDSTGKILAQDDDSGGYPNARIVWTAQYTGNYRVVATSFKQGEVGAYTITVTP